MRSMVVAGHASLRRGIVLTWFFTTRPAALCCGDKNDRGRQAADWAIALQCGCKVLRNQPTLVSLATWRPELRELGSRCAHVGAITTNERKALPAVPCQAPCLCCIPCAPPFTSILSVA